MVQFNLMINNYKDSSKTLFGIVVISVIVFGLSSLSVATALTNVNFHKAMAIGVPTTNSAIILQSPIYIEIDKTTSQKAVVVNGTIHATEVSFSGHGTTRGVNYTDSGKGLFIPRGDSGVINTKGQVTMMTGTGEKASATFQETGHPDANGIITATGAAFFDANATVKLSYLGNSVAVYKDIIYKDRTDKVIAWEWK